MSAHEELIRTAAVVAQREDVSEVLIVTTSDDHGKYAEITAARCPNPDCGRVHIHVSGIDDSRFLWDSEESVAVEVAADDED